MTYSFADPFTIWGSNTTSGSINSLPSNIRGSGNASPGPADLAARAILVSNGVIVNNN